MRRLSDIYRASVALSVAVAITAGTVAAQHLTYSGSTLYSNGDYLFPERTTSVSITSGLTLTSGRVGVSAAVPIIYQDSPWVSYSTIGPVPSGGPDNGAVSEQRGRPSEGNGGSGSGSGSSSGGSGGGRSTSENVATATSAGKKVVVSDTTSYESTGLGDPSIRATVTAIREGAGRPGVQAAFGVKIPIADVERGFGTGAWDVGAGVSLSKKIKSRFLFLDFMYWNLGDMDDLVLKNAVSYRLAVGSLVANARGAVLASITGLTRIIDGADPPIEVGLLTSYYTTAKSSIAVGTSFGLSESSPDFALSIGWNIGLN